MTKNIDVLVAARDEYIEQLKCIILPLLIQGFNSIYADAIKMSENKRVIYKFQQLLKEIPQWNQTILQEESKRIKKKCPYIMDIVTAIFVSNVKILASIRLKGNNDNIKVRIPTSDIFIHSIYIETAQQIFYDPFLFYHKNPTSKVQENKQQIRTVIRYSIDETIRQMLPFDDILQEYLANALNDSESGSESEHEIDGDRIIGSDSDSDSNSDSVDSQEEPRNIDLSGNTFGQHQQEESFEDQDPVPLPEHVPVPLQQEHVQLQQEHIPLQQEHVPVPLQQEHIPLQQEHVPVPLQQEHMPVPHQQEQKNSYSFFD